MIHAVRRRFSAPMLVFCWFVAVSPASRAALGGTLDTVTDDEARMHAARTITGRAGYEVHELVLASGTVVREFVAPSGIVFGVAWQGPFKPDLSQLLGGYFPRLATAAKGQHGDHRMLRLNVDDLVIESGGRMRAFAGRAFVPQLLPAQVPAGDIR